MSKIFCSIVRAQTPAVEFPITAALDFDADIAGAGGCIIVRNFGNTPDCRALGVVVVPIDYKFIIRAVEFETEFASWQVGPASNEFIICVGGGFLERRISEPSDGEDGNNAKINQEIQLVAGRF